MRTRGASERTSDLASGMKENTPRWIGMTKTMGKMDCARDKTEKNNVFIFSFIVELVCLGSDFSCLCKFCIYFIAGVFLPYSLFHSSSSSIFHLLFCYHSFSLFAAKFSIIDKFLFAFCLQSAGFLARLGHSII